MSQPINKVLYNVDQRTDLTDTEQLTARQNIGACKMQTVSGARPPVTTVIDTVQLNEMNNKLIIGDHSGLLVPEPTFATNGKFLQAQWSGASSGTLATLNWVDIPKDCAIVIYAGSPEMSEADFNTIQTAVSERRMAYVLYGNSGGSYYYRLARADSTGYDFIYESEGNKRFMHIAMNRAVTITTPPPNDIKTYWMGNTSWHDNITLKGESSGHHYIDSLIDLAEPITLYAGHKYLVQSTCYGTAEYTTARSYDGTAHFSMEILLTDANHDTYYNNCVLLALAQFYFNGQKGSNTPGYHFVVGIYPVATIIEPSSTVTLTTTVLMNSGNVLGTDSDHTAKMFLDYRLGRTIVQEIA